ncbi:putative cytochrome c [Alcaligenes faecalis subsp. faecalis NCIB 8687]|nr:putative cytochrome c [Alcaligenes faecalis subsp. faecalis NCIB 8687]
MIDAIKHQLDQIAYAHTSFFRVVESATVRPCAKVGRATLQAAARVTKRPKLVTPLILPEYSSPTCSFTNQHFDLRPRGIIDMLDLQRPKDPRQTGTLEQARVEFHDGEESYYGKKVNGLVLGGGVDK